MKAEYKLSLVLTADKRKQPNFVAEIRTGCGDSLHSLALGFCDRASWEKYEERKTNKMQQLDVYY